MKPPATALGKLAIGRCLCRFARPLADLWRPGRVETDDQTAERSRLFYRIVAKLPRPCGLPVRRFPKDQCSMRVEWTFVLQGDRPSRIGCTVRSRPAGARAMLDKWLSVIRAIFTERPARVAADIQHIRIGNANSILLRSNLPLSNRVRNIGQNSRMNWLRRARRCRAMIDV